MSEHKIRAALTNRLVTAIAEVFPNPTALEVENAVFAVPEGATLWLSAKWLPGDAQPITLGEEGHDRHTGLFQIDVNVLNGTGDGNLLLALDTLKSYFCTGYTASYEDVAVRLGNSSITPGRKVASFWRRSITISYSADIVRYSASVDDVAWDDQSVVRWG